MPRDPVLGGGVAVHASAVAIDGVGLLVFGASGAGKSRLVAALVARSRPGRRIELVGDDRIVLRGGTRQLEARPHPRIAGFLERRGLGLVAMPWRARAPVGGAVALGGAEPSVPGWTGDVATLRIAEPGADAGAAAVLAWWCPAARQRGASRRAGKVGCCED